VTRFQLLRNGRWPKGYFATRCFVGVTAVGAIPVTADNFKRAETDVYFALFANQGGFGKFEILRDLPLENTGVRPNRDTLYSLAVFDLDASPVTITMPDAGSRFMSLLVIDEDHYAREVAYGAGEHTYTRQQIGTRYLFMGVRILVNPADPQDFRQVHVLQDAIKVMQPGGPGRLEVPNWDQASQKKVRDALLVLNETLPDLRRAVAARTKSIRSDTDWHGIRLGSQSR
jgi:hypothetical protein